MDVSAQATNERCIVWPIKTTLRVHRKSNKILPVMFLYSPFYYICIVCNN